MKFLIVLISVFVSLQAVSAQSIVGRAIVDGRTAELLSDKTWRFLDSADIGCNALTTRLSFCGDPSQWVSVNPASGEIAAQYRYNDRNYAQYIIEELGRLDGLNMQGVRNAILSNAASASNRSQNDVPVYDINEVAFQDQNAETLTYGVIVDGTDYVFMNTIVLTDDLILQVISYSVGNEWTDELKTVHAKFLDATKVQMASK